MSSAAPLFFKGPLRYFKWASINKPAYFYSCILGGLGPAMFVIAPPVRRLFNDTENIPKIPETYPIPKGPRPRPEGFDD